jgi:hypothetical protein
LEASLGYIARSYLKEKRKIIELEIAASNPTPRDLPKGM